MISPTHISGLFGSGDRLMVGVMSGTSVDAVDVAIVSVKGSGKEIRVATEGVFTYPIETELRAVVEANMIPETSSVSDLALLNVRLAHLYERAILESIDSSSFQLSDIDAIGSHGQTMHHIPEPTRLAGMAITATMQLGDPSILANLLGIPVVGDFRMADMALGGQGAPLVPYVDFVCFRDEKEGRLLINLGGIANITVLPAACELSDVQAFDTGPANRILDSLAVRLLDMPFDRDGKVSSTGRSNPVLLGEFLSDAWFSRPPPKSTGREMFSDAYVDRFVEGGRLLGLSDADLFATAVELTVRSIQNSWVDFVLPDVPIARVIVSGGGAHNPCIMDGLADAFAGIPVETSRNHGMDPDGKEAICFAVLAHETLNGVASNVPAATGARSATILGKICLPASQI